MKAFVLFVRVLSVAFIVVAALHLLMGAGADALLGVPVTPHMFADPSIDSQNRFYGITFSLLGVALLISVTDVQRYEPIIVATLGVLFLAGIARVVSWAMHGAPSPAIIAIACADLLLPPLLHVWLKRVSRAAR